MEMSVSHDDFVNSYRSGAIHVSVDRARAMHVCDQRHLMPARLRIAHEFWKLVAVGLFLGGCISLIWLAWWVGIAAAALGVMLMPMVQESATQFVLEHALEDADFYDLMSTTGIFVLRSAATSSLAHRSSPTSASLKRM
jgi:uncharacterized membrane protein